MLISTRSSVIASETSEVIVFGPGTNAGYASRGIFLVSARFDEATILENGCDELVVEILELCSGVLLMLSFAGAQVRGLRGTPEACLSGLIYSLVRNASRFRKNSLGNIHLVLVKRCKLVSIQFQAH